MRTIHTLSDDALKYVTSSIPLLPHQEDGISMLLANQRYLLFDEAGTAKTRQILEAAKHFIYGRKLLVICPACIVLNWKKQAELWGFPKEKIEVYSYELLVRRFVSINKGRYGVIVADEAHYLKNWGAQRTKAFKKLLYKRDSRVWLMTGTPIVNGAMDVHPLVSFVQPGVWGKFGDFCENYCLKKKDDWHPQGFRWYGAKNVNELKKRLAPIMLRRFLKDVIEDMPDKLLSKVPIEIEQFNRYNDIKTIEDLLRAVEKEGTKDEKIIETLRDLGLTKAPKVVDFVEDTLPEHAVIIFAHHRSVIHDLKDRFEEKGRAAAMIIGGMSKEAKWNTIGEFQEGKIDRLIVSIHACGVGIDLFRSHHCVFAEFPWTQAAIDQAVARLYRQGQKNCVNVYYLYGQATFEEPMLQAIEKKQSIMERTVGYG